MNLHKEIETTLGYLEAVKDDDVRYELIHHLEELLSFIRGCITKPLTLEELLISISGCKTKTPLTLEELNNGGWFTEDLSVEFSEALQAKGLNVYCDWAFNSQDCVSASFSTGAAVTRNLLGEHSLYTKGKKEIYLQDGEFYWGGGLK